MYWCYCGFQQYIGVFLTVNDVFVKTGPTLSPFWHSDITDYDFCSATNRPLHRFVWCILLHVRHLFCGLHFWQCDARQQFKHNFERLTMAILSLWFFTFVHSLEWCVPSEKNRKDVSLLSVCGQNEVVVSTSFRRKGSGHVITYVICSPNYF